MGSDRFRRVREIVLQARGLPSEERAVYLRAACEGDDALRRDVESLLEQEGTPASILSPGRVAQDLAGQLVADAESPADLSHLERIGPYRLVELLGEGGMGVVYRAEQREPIQREVALKVIRWSLASEHMSARFMTEREALSRMDHPNIAKVLDAGADERGRPYVVMELVRGEPITRYCDAQKLSIFDRIPLFLRVCQGVHHAHQKGVLHRDLKPSNILVEEIDAEPVPKIIDFGIAKTLEETSDRDQSLTFAGQLLGTPEYMSPEQAGETQSAVDTRADIYSLGILLHELLVGDLPVGRDTLKGKSPTEVVRLLREHEPRRPSTKFEALPPATRGRLCQNRGTTMASLARHLRGDLDWITLKAVARDPEDRYSSASELAADLRRHLADLPVEAGPPSRGAQLRKFVRRNRVPVTTAALLLLALNLGAAATTWQWMRAKRQAELAELRLEAVEGFSVKLIGDLDAQLMNLPGSTPVRESLAELTLEHLDALVEVTGDTRGIEFALSRGYSRLSTIQRLLGEPEQALVLIDKSIEAAEEGVQRRPTPGLRNTLALRYGSKATLLRHTGDTEAALQWHEKAAASFAQLAEDHPDYEFATKNLAVQRSQAGWISYNLGRHERARELLELATADMSKVRDEDPDDHMGWGNLGNFQSRLGTVLASLDEREAAERMLLASVETYEEAIPRFPKRDVSLQRELGRSLLRYGSFLLADERFDESLRMLERGREVRKRLAEKFPSRLDLAVAHADACNRIGDVYFEQGEYETAREEFTSATRVLASYGEDDSTHTSPLVAKSRSYRRIGQSYLEDGEFVESKPFLLRAYNIDTMIFERDRSAVGREWALVHAEYLLAEYYARSGRQRENPELLESASSWYLRCSQRAGAMRERGVLSPGHIEELDEVLKARVVNDSLLTVFSES